VAWLIFISVLVWGGVLGKLLSLSSLERSNLVRISKSLLPRWSILQRLCCSSSWEQFLLVLFIKMLSISLVLPEFQDGYNINGSEQDRYKNENKDAKLFSCF
jgi:hypothetical protein